MKFFEFLKHVFIDHWYHKLLVLILAAIVVVTANLVGTLG